MTQESRMQEAPTRAPEPGELTDVELTRVVGGTDAPPPSTGTSNGRS